MIRRLFGISIVIMALGMVDASAETLRITGWDPNAHGQISVNGPGMSYSGNAGRLAGLLNGVSFTTYCSQLDQFIGFGNNYTDYSIVPTGGVGGFNTTQATNLGKLFTFASASVTDALTSTAFQLAVWEIVYETSGTYSVSSGVFTGTDGTAGVVALANTYLAGISTITNSGFSIQRLVSPNQQDMIYARVIPEPATTALMGAGLLWLGYRARLPSRSGSKSST